MGVAWIDGVIKPKELLYLYQIARNFQLTEEPEIKHLLSELKPIQPSECYQWLEEYLAENPSNQNYQELFEKICSLIYSDDYVDVREAKLIEVISYYSHNSDPRNSILNKMLQKIKQLFKEAINSQINSDHG